MQNIILAIHLILAVMLIVVVLLQRSEGGGLGVGGGNNNSRPAGLGKLDAMQRLTWVLGGSFFCTSIVLTILATSGAGSQSLLDQLDGVSASEVLQESAIDGDQGEIPADPNAGSENAVQQTAPVKSESSIPSDPNAQ